MLSQQSQVKCPHCGFCTTVGEIGDHIVEVHIGSEGTNWLCSNGCPYQTGSARAIAVHCLLTGHPASLIQRKRNDLTFASFLAEIQAQFPNPSQDRDRTEDYVEAEQVAWDDSCPTSCKAGFDIAEDAGSLDTNMTWSRSEDDLTSPMEPDSEQNLELNYSQKSISEVQAWISDSRFAYSRPKRPEFGQPKPVYKNPKNSKSICESGSFYSKAYCQICEKGLKASPSPMNLMDHIFSRAHQSHSADKDISYFWRCDCGRKFFSTSNLRRHAKDSSNHCRLEQTSIQADEERVVRDVQAAFTHFSNYRLRNGVRKIFSEHVHA